MDPIYNTITPFQHSMVINLTPQKRLFKNSHEKVFSKVLSLVCHWYSLPLLWSCRASDKDVFQSWHPSLHILHWGGMWQVLIRLCHQLPRGCDKAVVVNVVEGLVQAHYTLQLPHYPSLELTPGKQHTLFHPIDFSPKILSLQKKRKDQKESLKTTWWNKWLSYFRDEDSWTVKFIFII